MMCAPVITGEQDSVTTQDIEVAPKKATSCSVSTKACSLQKTSLGYLTDLEDLGVAQFSQSPSKRDLATAPKRIRRSLASRVAAAWRALSVKEEKLPNEAVGKEIEAQGLREWEIVEREALEYSASEYLNMDLEEILALEGSGNGAGKAVQSGEQQQVRR